MENNTFIISDYNCNCYSYYGFILHKCNNCKVKNLINFEDIDEVMNMLQRIDIKKPLNLIIHTEGGTSCCADAISYLLTSHNIDVYTTVPQYAQSAGTVLALCGKKIHCNWYSLFSPVDSQLEYITSGDNEDEELTFSAKHMQSITNKENNLDKLQGLEAKDHHNEDKFILNRILKNNVNKEEIIKKLANSDFSHEFNITYHDMKKMGLPVDLNIDSKINTIFNLFKKLN
jgi:ClpP class serine protease